MKVWGLSAHRLSRPRPRSLKRSCSVHWSRGLRALSTTASLRTSFMRTLWSDPARTPLKICERESLSGRSSGEGRSMKTAFSPGARLRASEMVWGLMPIKRWMPRSLRRIQAHARAALLISRRAKKCMTMTEVVQMLHTYMQHTRIMRLRTTGSSLTPGLI